MSKIPVKNLKEELPDLGLFDLKTHQKFFVIGANFSTSTISKSPQVGAVIISEREADSLSDLLQEHPDRPFLLRVQYSIISSQPEYRTAEYYLEIIGSKVLPDGKWKFHIREIADNFDVIKRLTHLSSEPC
ncbi:MAG: hypothetical protein ACREBJ_04655 [Nitrosotalea sp.]